MGVVPTKAHHTLGEPHIDAFAVKIEAMVLFQEMDDEPNEVGLAFNFWGIADDAEMSQAKSSQWTPGHSSFLLCWYRLSVCRSANCSPRSGDSARTHRHYDDTPISHKQMAPNKCQAESDTPPVTRRHH